MSAILRPWNNTTYSYVHAFRDMEKEKKNPDGVHPADSML